MSTVTFTSSVLPPRERGLELGERFRSEIADTVAAYRRLFTARATGPFDVDRWAERAWEAIRTHAPVHAEEIAGIAEGAGRPVRELAAVNARTELLVAADPTGTGECSTVVALPPGRPAVAMQTWDWYDAMGANWLHWTIPHPDGRRVETVTEFGMLAKIGVNDRGVGVMLNMLHHENDAKAAAEERVGYPVHLLARSILDDASDVADGRRIASAATSASTSLTLVDRRGAAASVELLPGGPGVLEPYDGLLVRTNHFVSDAGRDGCLGAAQGPSSELRRDALLEAFAGRVPSSAEEVRAAMVHHDDEGGVCAHVDEGLDPVLRHRTLATVALDVASGHLDVRPGGPCGGS
ncbi:MAG: C45 family autoproteolytic acyltransferase/hydrolase [Nocardioidaceae bacterium]